MRIVLVLCGIIAVCSGQYSYNAPSGGSSFAGSGLSGGQVNIGSSGGSFGVSSGGSFGTSSGSSFGVSSGSSFSGSSGSVSGGSGYSTGGQQMYANSFSGYSNQAPIVHKHVYVHVAPPEPEEKIFRAPPQVQAPTKHYKIIFVKTPSPPAYSRPVIPLQPQNEEKTLVYVLVKRPEDQPDVVIPTAAPTPPSKPEVYFIKYKTQKEAVSGGSVGGFIGGGSSGGIIGGGSSGGIIGGGSSGGIIGGGSSGGILGGGSSGGILGGGSSGGILGGGSSGGILGGGSSGGISIESLARGGGSPAPKYGTPAFQ